MGMLYSTSCSMMQRPAQRITRMSEDVGGKSPDAEKNQKELEVEGLEAICLQHELDHLNGIVFIEKLSLLKQNLIKKKLQIKR